MGPTAFPAVADRASGRAGPVHRARHRRQGHPSRAWRGRWNGGRISGRSDRATNGIGSPSLRCEIGRCGRPREPPSRNPGTRGLANLGARAAQNPEPRHQVAVTRLDVHHTVGGSAAERQRSRQRRPGIELRTSRFRFAQRGPRRPASMFDCDHLATDLPLLLANAASDGSVSLPRIVPGYRWLSACLCRSGLPRSRPLAAPAWDSAFECDQALLPVKGRL